MVSGFTILPLGAVGGLRCFIVAFLEQFVGCVFVVLSLEQFTLHYSTAARDNTILSQKAMDLVDKSKAVKLCPLR